MSKRIRMNILACRLRQSSFRQIKSLDTCVTRVFFFFLELPSHLSHLCFPSAVSDLFLLIIQPRPAIFSLSKPPYQSIRALSNQADMPKQIWLNSGIHEVAVFEISQNNKCHMWIKQFVKMVCSTKSITNYELNVKFISSCCCYWLSE